MIFIQREELRAGQDAQTLHRPDRHMAQTYLSTFMLLFAFHGVFFFFLDYYILFAITHIFILTNLSKFRRLYEFLVNMNILF